MATAPTPTLDRALARLSNAANDSKLWLATASFLAVAGGRRGRRAALLGVASIAVSSLVNNILGKAFCLGTDLLIRPRVLLCD